MSIRFNETEVRTMGRQAVGVNGIRLAGEGERPDEVVAMEVLARDASVLTVTERGYGKRTREGEYPLQHRAGMGVITIKTTERNGRVAGAIQVAPGDQAMLITDGGTLIRISTNDVSEIGRNTQGVRLLNVEDGERVISVVRIAEPADEPTTPLASAAASGEGAAVTDGTDGSDGGDGEG
jgi:DNA gyrase subunit A